jgi:hypothetical protein
MNETRFDQSVKVLANAAGRRDALRSLGVAGMALLAAFGFGDASATHRAKSGGQGGAKHRNKHRGQKRRRSRTQP